VCMCVGVSMSVLPFSFFQGCVLVFKGYQESRGRKCWVHTHVITADAVCVCVYGVGWARI